MLCCFFINIEIINLYASEIMNKLLIVLLLCYCAACTKTPVAEFSASSTDAIPGQTVVFTNKSKDADSYIWTLPDGSTVTSENASFTFNERMDIGNTLIRLTAYSKNKKKSDDAVKNVTFRKPLGSGVFWVSNNAYVGTEVFLNLNSIGSVNAAYTVEPFCGMSGVANTYLIPVGSYAYNAVSSSKTWNGTLIISENECTKIKLD